MLCYVMLCYVMLCYVMLCYVMLCYVITWTSLISATFICNICLCGECFLSFQQIFVLSCYSMTKIETVCLYSCNRNIVQLEVAHYEGVGGIGAIAPFSHNLGTSWKWVATFTPRPLYREKTIFDTHCAKVWVGTTYSLLDVLAKRLIFSSCRKLNRDSSSFYLHSRSFVDSITSAEVNCFFFVFLCFSVYGA
jgi:hypothetical protein